MSLYRFFFAFFVGLFACLARGDGGAYTNHAGHAVCGVPVSLTRTEAVVSNATETLRLPLTVFPAAERRRLAADYLLAHPAANPDLLPVPADVKTALAGPRRALARAQKRAARGFCTDDDLQALTETTRAAIATYLDKAEADGRITAAERKVLER